MTEEMKAKALTLKEKAIAHKDKLVLASVAAGTVFLAIYASKKTVAHERKNVREELTNGNVVVHLNDKDYFTFSIMTDDGRIEE
jgi:hypothetical protein